MLGNLINRAFGRHWLA